jgi:hypothetical protein
VQTHRVELESEPGETHWWFLCSDLHAESPSFDLARFKRDMDAARRINARVLINGDVFDAIPPGDKRWTPTCVRKSLRGEDDLFDATTKWVGTLLEPYADLIEVIGIGNHERAWTKRHHSDPVGAVLQHLNRVLASQKSSHRIRHGGVAGFILTHLKFPMRQERNWGLLHRLLYLHGAGGEAPVTKGLIDINRKATNFEYDAITFGHKHNRVFVDDVVLCVTRNGRPYHRETKALPTGSYSRGWRLTSQDKPLSYHYCEDWAASPKPLGGMFLALTPESSRGTKSTGTMVIRQDVATYPRGLGRT